MFSGLIFSLILFHVSVADGSISSSFFELPTVAKISGAITLSRDMAVSFINQYNEDRRQELGTLDATLSGFTVAFRQMLKSKMPLFSIEDNLSMLYLYLCTNFGVVSDMKTIRKIDKNSYLWHSDGSLDITVYYEVQKFKISYGTFYFKLSNPVTGDPVNAVRGNITLSYGSNRISVKMQVMNLIKAMKALTDETEAGCVVYVKDFVWEKLDDIGVKIESNSKLNTNDLLTKFVGRMVSQHQAMMIYTMEKQVLMELFNMLPKKPVCRHDQLKEKAAEYQVNKPRTFSSQFQEKCGTLWQPKVKDSPLPSMTKLFGWRPAINNQQPNSPEEKLPAGKKQ